MEEYRDIHQSSKSLELTIKRINSSSMSNKEKENINKFMLSKT